MEKLNDPNSEIYKKTIEVQKKFISDRLKKIKNRYLDDKMGCMGTKDVIASHLNKGPAQNLVQTFFKYKQTTCLQCGKSKGDIGVRQFERAHCNNYSRKDLLLLALDDLYVDETTPIITGDILKRFIQKHELCPIYILCNMCHNTYDN